MNVAHFLKRISSEFFYVLTNVSGFYHSRSIREPISQSK